MKCAILAVTVALAVSTTGMQAAKKKPKPDVGAGHIAWFDITTTKMSVSKEFYSKLFDWTFTSLPGTDLAAEIVCGGTSIGSLRVAEGKISSFNGVAYVQVADMQASCKKAKELGGTLPPGFPFNLEGEGGSVAIVGDPAGHPIGMYCRTPLPPAPPPGK